MPNSFRTQQIQLQTLRGVFSKASITHSVVVISSLHPNLGVVLQGRMELRVLCYICSWLSKSYYLHEKNTHSKVSKLMKLLNSYHTLHAYKM